MLMESSYVDFFVLGLFGLLGFIAADIITGFVKGYVNKDLNSAKNFRGYLRKFLILLIPALGFGLDYLMNIAFDLLNYDSFLIGGFNLINKPILGLFFILWFLLGEILSIIENLGQAGVRVPKFISKRLSQIQDDVDEGKFPKK